MSDLNAFHKEVDDQILTCTLCMERYTSNGLRVPKVLSCMHTFCEGCLAGWAARSGSNNIECPLDREITHLSGAGVGGLRNNLMVLNMLDIYEKHPDKASKPPVNFDLRNFDPALHKCHICGNSFNEVENIWGCSECEGYLCEICRGVHQTGAKYELHSSIVVKASSILIATNLSALAADVRSDETVQNSISSWGKLDQELTGQDLPRYGLEQGKTEEDASNHAVGNHFGGLDLHCSVSAMEHSHLATHNIESIKITIGQAQKTQSELLQVSELKLEQALIIEPSDRLKYQSNDPKSPRIFAAWDITTSLTKRGAIVWMNAQGSSLLNLLIQGKYGLMRLSSSVDADELEDVGEDIHIPDEPGVLIFAVEVTEEGFWVIFQRVTGNVEHLFRHRAPWSTFSHIDSNEDGWTIEQRRSEAFDGCFTANATLAVAPQLGQSLHGYNHGLYESPDPISAPMRGLHDPATAPNTSPIAASAALQEIPFATPLARAAPAALAASAVPAVPVVAASSTELLMGLDEGYLCELLSISPEVAAELSKRCSSTEGAMEYYWANEAKLLEEVMRRKKDDDAEQIPTLDGNSRRRSNIAQSTQRLGCPPIPVHGERLASAIGRLDETRLREGAAAVSFSEKWSSHHCASSTTHSAVDRQYSSGLLSPPVARSRPPQRVATIPPFAPPKVPLAARIQESVRSIHHRSSSSSYAQLQQQQQPQQPQPQPPPQDALEIEIRRACSLHQQLHRCEPMIRGIAEMGGYALQDIIDAIVVRGYSKESDVVGYCLDAIARREEQQRLSELLRSRPGYLNPDIAAAAAAAGSFLQQQPPADSLLGEVFAGYEGCWEEWRTVIQEAAEMGFPLTDILEGIITRNAATTPLVTDFCITKATLDPQPAPCSVALLRHYLQALSEPEPPGEHGPEPEPERLGRPLRRLGQDVNLEEVFEGFDYSWSLLQDTVEGLQGEGYRAVDILEAILMGQQSSREDIVAYIDQHLRQQQQRQRQEHPHHGLRQQARGPELSVTELRRQLALLERSPDRMAAFSKRRERSLLEHRRASKVVYDRMSSRGTRSPYAQLKQPKQGYCPPAPKILSTSDLFGGDDDDDLFGTKPKPKAAQAPVAKKAATFDLFGGDDDDDDLFISKPKSKAAQAPVAKKAATSGLFGGDDDDDDFFGSKPKPKIG